MRDDDATTVTGRPGLGGRIAATLFLAFFDLMGGLFLVLMIGSLAKSAQVRSWDERPCRIERSQVLTPADGGNYGFAVAYVYRDAAGQERRSERLSIDGDKADTLAKARRLADRFPAGAETVCLVNPGNSSEAVLTKDIPWLMLPFMLIPLLFVAIGSLGIWGVWRPQPVGPAVVPLAVVGRKKKASSPLALAGLFLFFFLIGGGLLIPFGILPVWRVMQAKDWPTVPCRILSSQVASHSDSDGTTYSVDILYEYEYGGCQGQSNRYDFMGGSSSGHSGKQAVVDRYPPGSEAVCHVDPDDPALAVLQPGFTPMMLVGLVPLLFMLIGLGGVIAALRRRFAGANLARPGLDNAGAAASDAYNPRSFDDGYRAAKAVDLATMPEAMLKPDSLWEKAFVVAFAAVFWNGIVSVFVGIAVRGWMKGNPEWFLMVFLIPFVVIGLILVGAMIHGFLAAFNPRPRLRLGGPLCPGATVDIGWQFSGRVARIREMDIHLDGWESALKGGEKSTSWQRSCFCRLPVVRTDDPMRISQGEAAVALPADILLGWSTERQRLSWVLRCRGRIDHWPDIDAEFPVTLLSPEVGHGASHAPNPFKLGDVIPSTERTVGESTLDLVLAEGRTAFEPGETVSGRASWHLRERPQALELRLSWVAGSGESGDVVMVATASLPTRDEGTVEFTLHLPRAPISCSGMQVCLQWALELVAVRPDMAVRREFVMAPGACEVRLGTVADESFGDAFR